ncbi:hypothetical protein [Streptomyces sp. NPDC006784]|uniref:hypothetical protein n=1 Tax=Streptomyces sp. NPDC006784 TaxID=3364764 RepID=UPI0036B4B000
MQQALRAVPRNRFTPETPLSTAYDGDLAVVTLRDESGTAVSSVSAAWLQADMLEELHLEPGMTVFEAGSGGYNAELMAGVIAPTGRVITVDLDPYVIHRTRRLTGLMHERLTVDLDRPHSTGVESVIHTSSNQRRCRHPEGGVDIQFPGDAFDKRQGRTEPLDVARLLREVGHMSNRCLRVNRSHRASERKPSTAWATARRTSSESLSRGGLPIRRAPPTTLSIFT